MLSIKTGCLNSCYRSCWCKDVERDRPRSWLCSVQIPSTSLPSAHRCQLFVSFSYVFYPYGLDCNTNQSKLFLLLSFSTTISHAIPILRPQFSIVLPLPITPLCMPFSECTLPSTSTNLYASIWSPSTLIKTKLSISNHGKCLHYAYSSQSQNQNDIFVVIIIIVIIIISVIRWEHW